MLNLIKQYEKFFNILGADAHHKTLGIAQRLSNRIGRGFTMTLNCVRHFLPNFLTIFYNRTSRTELCGHDINNVCFLKLSRSLFVLFLALDLSIDTIETRFDLTLDLRLALQRDRKPLQHFAN